MPHPPTPPAAPPATPPASDPPKPGDLVFVGKYQLVERLAIGGMAEVFLGVKRPGATEALPPAWRPGTDHLVVLKRILPHLAEKPEFVEAFVREARITFGIRHPNVVQILECGEAGGLPFIAMEYVSGSSLKQLVVGARQLEVRIAPDVAVSLICQAAAGLHAAHELCDITGKPYGLVHRDISPHNLMVDEQGVVKLLDFGIAKAEEGMDHTRTGMLKGKISYMSPEQCRQERLDRRSDVFSLGVVAFELLTQQRPFQGASELATMQAIVAGKRPALRELCPDLSLRLGEVIDRAMHAFPDDRFPTAQAFAEALAVACPPADLDRVSLFVRTVLGARHETRRKSVGEALERTLVSLSDQPVALPDRAPGSLEAYGNTGGGPVPRGTRSGSAARPAVVLPPPEVPAPVHRGRGWLIGAAVATLLALVVLGSAVAYGVATFLLGPHGAPIVVRMAPVMNDAEMERDHSPTREWLEAEIGRPIVFEIGSSYEGAAQALLDDEVDFAFLPAGTVKWLHDRDADVQVLAVKQVDGSASTDGYLLVRREGGPTSVEELKGRTVCLADPLSSTGWKLPRAFLEAQGFDLTRDVAILASGTHVKVLTDLLDGRCDAGATYSGNFNSADQRGIATARLRILATTGSAPHDAFVASADADPAEVAAVKAALLSFHPEERGDGAVAERITGFVAPPPDYLAP